MQQLLYSFFAKPGVVVCAALAANAVVRLRVKYLRIRFQSNISYIQRSHQSTPMCTHMSILFQTISHIHCHHLDRALSRQIKHRKTCIIDSKYHKTYLVQSWMRISPGYPLSPLPSLQILQSCYTVLKRQVQQLGLLLQNPLPPY